MEYEVLFLVWYDYRRGDRLTCATTESKNAVKIVRQDDVVKTWVRGTSDA